MQTAGISALSRTPLALDANASDADNKLHALNHHYVDVASLKVDRDLKQFIDSEVLPGTDIQAEQFWSDFNRMIENFAPKNAELLLVRDRMQQQIDEWHKSNRLNLSQNETLDKKEYTHFLQSIGYLAPRVGDFKITTQQVDDEIARQAGPQLVVPVKNARFALNAANARWGSLYDALYGSDVIDSDGGAEAGKKYNPVRGKKVIQYAKYFLDEAIPLAEGSHSEATAYSIRDGQLDVSLMDGLQTSLLTPEKFIGYRGDSSDPVALLFCNHGLHIEIKLDANGVVGCEDSAGIDDVVLESALTTIMDCEDSVAAVDAEDKIDVYRNWLGLMKGDLTVSFEKNTRAGKQIIERKLNDDKEFTGLNGEKITLSGRSLLFIRNVGHLMTTGAILRQTSDDQYQEIPEGIMDGVITSLIGMHDLKRSGSYSNSSKGSIYIVKPKMHGPQEVEFTDSLFADIESMLGLQPNTIKLGIMDEERRTSLNLKACIKKASARVVFINTGFLDRTGDEIHTSMHAGPMVPKTQMKQQLWLNAYEEWNVDTGLDCGLSGRAQIGKGMWAMPDKMRDMMQNKIGHPQAGANTAWVPSPTAATLHVMHYHQVPVFKQQRIIENRINKDMPECFGKLLEIPLLYNAEQLSEEDIRREVENNCQGILGYVVRWIDQGIGCSKVPDIHNVGLMEDRATLRISSQHLSNWLLHGICTRQQVEQALLRMAAVVDEQNADDAQYQPMLPNVKNSLAFIAASALIFEGETQPNGYTEPLLHHYRLLKKAQLAKG
ncbi:Malate synthase G [Thalassocella blandensis]|nr:Malate synthase G [Thalassocella blandensis]